MDHFSVIVDSLERAPEIVLQEAAKAIPFLGFLIALGYAGHRVWMFEGHPSALAAGLEHAAILLLDSGMLPLLQTDWMSVAQRMMAPPRRVLIQSRERQALLPVAPASTSKMAQPSTGAATKPPSASTSSPRPALDTLRRTLTTRPWG